MTFNTNEKRSALAKFLDVSEELIDNNYSEYFVVNERVIKEGHTPEWYEQVAKDFKSLIDEKHQELITKAIKAKDILSKEDRDVVYNTVAENLKPLGDRAAKYAEHLKTINGDLSPKFKEKYAKELTYLKLEKEHLYVVNPLYWFLNFDEKYSTDHAEQLQNAWLGKPVNDIRKDRTVNDGEYLVLTDNEADDWEKEGLENLFDDMTSEVPDNLKAYMDTDKFVEVYSGDRGRNISGYDGTEHEQKFEDETYYIYRTN